MAPSCIISDIYRDIGRKSPFFIPPCIRRPRYTVCYKEKLECCGYLTVKKFDDICITVFFSTGVHDVTDHGLLYDAIDGQTDIFRQRSPRCASRGRNMTYMIFSGYILGSWFP